MLFDISYMRYDMNGIQSKDHNIGLYTVNKINLSSYNDKWCILEDGYSRLSHFHKSACWPHTFDEYRQFVLIFALVRTATSFTIFPLLWKLDLFYSIM